MVSGVNPEQEIKRVLEDRNLRFPARPCLVADAAAFQMPDGLGVQFHGAELPVIIRGSQADAAIAFLLRTLDGTRTIDDLLAECPPQVARVTLLRTLSLLHAKGLLTGTEPPGIEVERTTSVGAPTREEVSRRQLLFWGRKLGITRSSSSAVEVQRRFETSRLVLIGTGLFAAQTYQLLVRTGCRHIQVLDWDDDGILGQTLAEGPAAPARLAHLPSTSVEEAIRRLPPLLAEADLLVTATRNAPADLFRAVNRTCLERKCRWLRANEDGTQIEIGPYVRPFGSACYRCMELRQASAHDFAVEEHLYQQHLGAERPAGENPPVGEALPVAVLAASLVSLEVVRVLTGIAVPVLLNAVQTVDPLGGTVRTNRILRVPRCPECYRGNAFAPLDAGAHA
jgi:bacteriocin biosynthesis cyclodehydratase domain-containing protein